MSNSQVIGFKDNMDAPTIWVYVHWREEDIVSAVKAIVSASRSRWNDPDYATRIGVSYLLKHVNNTTTGAGIGLNRPSTDEDLVAVICWEDQQVQWFGEEYRPIIDRTHFIDFEDLTEVTEDSILTCL